MPRALISVSDKQGIVEFARALAGRGFDIVSTGGTARTLDASGVRVTPVASVTGFPEMLDGRVKTLHPAVHAGILARRDRPDDRDAIGRQGIAFIDLVAVNLYPFARAAAREETTFDELIEEIDIGGPTLVRAAAKNFRDVLVVVDPADYDAVVDAICRPEGASPELRFELARKAFAHTAAYDAMIAGALRQVRVTDGRFEKLPSSLGAGWPDDLRVSLTKRGQLRYGENPHQQAAWYGLSGESGLAQATIVQGKELSFTNLLDLDAAVRIALEFDEPAAVVIKHTTPCGVATGDSAADAYLKARDADPLSAFGGIVGLNRPVDETTARALTSTFIEAVVAPRVDGVAREVLARRTALRVLEVDLARLVGLAGRDIRTVVGAALVQERDCVVEARAEWPNENARLRVATRREPTREEWRALRFAWRVCAHVKSNAVVFTSGDRTLAIGAGQMSRVDAVRVAVMKAAAGLTGSVAASDAFFPFRDGLDAMAMAGATAVVQPGGSVRDAEVIAAADEHGIAMVFTGRRHFRH
ncbi:MAG: bifunctional phosphoribosylaminoimidazolecarboxamide formyltransferase/IMP cyclohydrolase [Acidobacteria bacterium]|nr:bifunctional phosphoribosylaminoimidazolecarboxamide formyltransferase/IMP cyclohydrolase [Acidobacteriota bacterium]